MVGKRGGFEWDTLLPWIIAIALFALIMVVYRIIKGDLGAWEDYIQNFLRFGR